MSASRSPMLPSTRWNLHGSPPQQVFGIGMQIPLLVHTLEQLIVVVANPSCKTGLKRQKLPSLI
jgi:hypothetical protein